MTPILENLFESEGKAAAEEIGKPLNPLSDTGEGSLARVHRQDVRQL